MKELKSLPDSLKEDLSGKNGFPGVLGGTLKLAGAGAIGVSTATILLHAMNPPGADNGGVMGKLAALVV